MSIIQGNAKQGSTRGFYDFPLEQSLRFNSGDTSYLYWVPSSAGNRKTWTWSGWVKGGLFKAGLFSAGNDIAVNSNYMAIVVESDYTLRLVAYNTNAFACKTNAVFRDPSAWYHVVVAFDTTQATAANRVKIYVNGVLQSLNSPTYPNQNVDHFINNNIDHALGRMFESDYYTNGYLAEVNFIDGTALDADSFGELKSGVWIPKDPSGLTYGTNGFRLSFADDAEVEAFNTVLYRGNGGTQSVTGMGFQPDLVWVKKRNNTSNNTLTDAVRGVDKLLFTNSTNAESTFSGGLSSFDSDGFSLAGGDTGFNASGDTYVAWGWKAGDSNVSNTDGSITSTVRANTTYGFSIVSYEGTGANATVGHGLGAEPDFIIAKNRDKVDDWAVYHSSTADAYTLLLNGTSGGFSGSAWTNSANNDSDTFNIGADGRLNEPADRIIAYCWAEKAGYSKFGSYTGNGSSDGPEVTTGFKPAFVLLKNSSNTSNWRIYDNTRDTSNPAGRDLFPDTSDAEESYAEEIDLLDNGFKLRVAGGTGQNTNGDTYIYAAFADTREAAFWLDQSGNDNDWQPVNLDHNDTVSDSPTDNFATLNPLDSNSTLSDGNLVMATPASGGGVTRATMGVTSGQWYWEATLTTGYQAEIGVIALENALPSYVQSASQGVTYAHDGYKFVNTTITAGYGDSFTTGDVIAVALDMDNTTVTFYKNGVSQGAATTSLTTGFTYAPAFGDSSNTGQVTWSVNFGQQPFKYDPPA